MEWKKKLLARLRERSDLNQTDLFSLAVALNHPARAEQMTAFLDANPRASADEIFREAGRIAFQKNA